MRKIFKIIIISVIPVLLTHCIPNYRRHEQELMHVEYLSEAQSIYLKGKQDGYIRYLRTLANIMADYESISASDRCDRYIDMLRSSIASEDDIVSLFTVWKPDAIDGMDSSFSVRVGSASSGQYAVQFDKKDGLIHDWENKDIDEAIRYLNDNDSKKDYVGDPVYAMIEGNETYLVKMMVPVINQRTGEIAGIDGSEIKTDMIQMEVEQILMKNDEIAFMSVYSNNGTILGHLVPGRAGEKLKDADTILYGDYIEEANEAVLKGYNFYCSAYSSILDTNLSIYMTPFYIGNSDTTWTITIAVAEAFFKRRRFF